MAKTKTKITVGEFDTISATADAVGLARSTLATAIERNEVEIAVFPSGYAVVNIASAERWRDDSARRRGPKSA